VIWILVIGLGLLAVALARYWYVPFLRDPKSIDLDRLGFKVTTPEHKRRVTDILTAFFGGFNAMLSERRMSDVRAACDKFPPLLRPFAHEGAAMGFPFKAIFSRKYKVRDFARAMEALSSEYFLMYQIGIGFWCGMVYRRLPNLVRRTADHLHPFYKYLCYDGFGFKIGLFHYLKGRDSLSTFFRFDGYSRHVCFQGFGRSLWFLFMDEPRLIKDAIARVAAPYRGDCYSGLGLAVAFTNMDDLRAAFNFSGEVESQYVVDYFLGIIIALYTRRAIDAGYFNERLSKLEPWQKSVAIAGLRSCDERFIDVAERLSKDHYEGWRRYIAEDLRLIIAPRAAGAIN
jgi:hypothetical protein